MVFVGPDHPSILHRGWCDRRDPACSRLVWSGTGVSFRFEGQFLSAELDGEGMIEVLLDGTLLRLLGPDLSSVSVELAHDLPAGPHVVELRKRTEPVAGTVSFEGFSLDPSGRALPPSEDPSPFLLFVGDSITCGYGNLAPSEFHPFAPETEDVFRSFAGIACRELSANFHASAWSGKGLLRNFDRDSSPTMPQLWGLVDPNEPMSAGGSRRVPDLAVVNLGSNDVFHDDPDWTEFVGAAISLGRDLRGAFPGLPLVWLDGPLLSDTGLKDEHGRSRPVLTRVRSALDEACRVLASDGPTWRFSLSAVVPGEPYGADYHPGLDRHRINGLELAAFLRTLPLGIQGFQSVD